MATVGRFMKPYRHPRPETPVNQPEYASSSQRRSAWSRERGKVEKTGICVTRSLRSRDVWLIVARGDLPDGAGDHMCK